MLLPFYTFSAWSSGHCLVSQCHKHWWKVAKKNISYKKFGQIICTAFSRSKILANQWRNSSRQFVRTTLPIGCQMSFRHLHWCNFIKTFSFADTSTWFCAPVSGSTWSGCYLVSNRFVIKTIILFKFSDNLSIEQLCVCVIVGRLECLQVGLL